MKTILSLLFVLLVHSPIAAKDWSIESLLTRAKVYADGTIEFSESRTYRFEGRYSRAEYEIRKQGFDRLYDIQVLMDGVPLSESDSKDPGTFRVRDRRSRLIIEWRYEAEDEAKVFEVRYKLAGAVVKGPEHSEFFWSFIGRKWDRSTLSSDIRIEFERTDSLTTLPVWVEGGTEEVWIASGTFGRVDVGTGFVHRRDGLRIRMVFPSSWVPDAPITDASYTLEAVQAGERAKLAQSIENEERDRVIAEFLQGLIPLILFIPMLVFGFMYNKYGRRFASPVRIPETGHTPPSELPPAVVSWMMSNRQVMPYALVATLLDLARRGFLSLSTAEVPQRFGKLKMITSVALTQKSASDSELQDFEVSLLTRIRDLSPQGSIRLPDLFPAGKSESVKWYTAWTQTVSRNASSRGYDDKDSKKGVAISAIVSFIFILISIFATIYVGILGVAALLLSTIFFGASFAIFRRTETGEILFRLWKAYRNGLKTGNKSELGSTTTGVHLVYSVAFGIQGKALTRMLETMGMDDTNDHWLSVSGFAHNPAIFASQVSSMVASASTGVSSSTGASAGSAGGGGGGGAS